MVAEMVRPSSGAAPMRPDYGPSKGELGLSKPISSLELRASLDPGLDNKKARSPGPAHMAYPPTDGSATERRQAGGRSTTTMRPGSSQLKGHIDNGQGSWRWPQSDVSCAQPTNPGALERPVSRSRQTASIYGRPSSRPGGMARGGPYAQSPQALAGSKEPPKTSQRGRPPSTDLSRGRPQQHSSIGMQQQHSIQGRSRTAQGTTRAQPQGFEPIGGITIDSTADAAAFFKQAGHLLSQSGSGEHTLASARPPPAGMRGALSWGIGPNAFENDGRPGTRGGGTAFDLEGRPVTRSGMRAASRQGRPGTGQQAALSYAAAVSAPTGPAGISLQTSIDPASPSARGTSSTRSPGVTGHVDRWSADSPATSPTSKAGRGAPQQNGRSGTMQRPQAAGSSSSWQQIPINNTGRSSSMFKVEEEGDVDAFLAGLSDDEGDATNMDDLKNYLSTLDQDRSPAPESSLASKSSHSRSTAASTPSPGRSKGMRSHVSGL